MMSWRDFKVWMDSQYRALTAYQYWLSCRRFLSWAKIDKPAGLEKLQPGDFIEYDDYLKVSGVKNRNMAGFAIRSLLSYYGLHDMVGKVPARREFVSKAPRWLPEPIILQMIELAPDYRIKAMMALSYDLALRIREALMLDIKPKSDTAYVDLRSGTANVYREKTKLYPWQTLDVGKFALDAARGYIKGERHDNCSALFTTAPYRPGGKGGGRMSVWWAERLWANFMVGLGLNPRLWNFKLLRHSKLTWMAVEGKDLVEIAKFAGHSTPNPTLIYVHLSSQYLNRPEIFLEELRGSKLYGPAMKVL